MLRVLFVLPDLEGGGAERVVLNLLRHLDRSQFRATLLLVRCSGRYWSEIPAHVRCVCAIEHGRWRYRLPRILACLLREARAHDLLVGGLEFLTTYLAYLAGRMLGKPVLGWVHTAAAQYTGQLECSQRLLARPVYRRLERLVFVSDGAAASMAAWLGRRGRGWHTIPNMLDLAPHADRLLQSVAEPWPGFFAAPVVLAAGRLDRAKGFDVLIRAFARLQARGPACRLLILGEGPMRSRLEGLVEELGLQGAVALPGFTANPFAYMRRATLLVSPSRFEGLGMVALEALAMGLPVIATDCPGGHAELLAGGRCGVLVRPEDPAELAQAMHRLLTDDALRERYRVQGRARAEDFRPERIAARWGEVLQEAAA